MADLIDDTETESPPRRRWGRGLAIAGVVVLLLLVVLFCLISSAYFFKGVVLPQLSKSLNADVSVATASISPFSKIVLKQVKIQTSDSEPLLTAEEVRVRYRLLSLLGGGISVQELTLIAPKLEVVEDTNGTRNLDRILAAMRTNQTAKPAESKGAPRVEVRNVSITQGSFRFIKQSKNGNQELTELSDINLTLDQLKSGDSGKLNLSANLSAEQRPASGTAVSTSDLLRAKVSGAYDFALDANLVPQTMKGSTRLATATARGIFAELGGLNALLECDLTPKELRQLGLRFERSGKTLGSVQLKGPLNLAEAEGHLLMEVSSIDRQVLNLFGAKHELDFGKTVLNAKSTIDIAQKGKVLTIDGNVKGNQVEFKQSAQTTPALDVELSYQINLNLLNKNALIRTLRLQANQGPAGLIRGKLDRPLNLSWGLQPGGFNDSSFQLGVTNLNLADWQAFLGNIAPAGQADLSANVVSQQDGKQISFELTSQIRDLTARWKTNQMEEAQVRLRVSGTLEQYKKIDLHSYQAELRHSKSTVATVKGSTSYNLDNHDLSSQTSLEASLPAFLQIYPLPELQSRSGTVRFSDLLEIKGDRQKFSGNLTLTDLIARYADYDFQNYQISCDYQIERENTLWQFPRLSVGFRQGYEAGGSLDMSGRWDQAKSFAQFTFRSVGLNQIALRPFLAAKLGANKLVSASLNADGSLVYNAQAESSLKGAFKVDGLQVEYPDKSFPQEPLSAQLQMNASFRESILDLSQLVLTLSPTERARNIMEMKGRLDFAKTNAMPGQLDLRSDSFDATRYYDLFTERAKTNVISASSSSKPPLPKTTPQEPAPVTLPFQQFTLDFNLGQFYLKDIAITNWSGKMKINRGQLALSPFKLTMNGAPINATANLDLGVPGYTYDLNLTADQLPVDPFMSSFSPDSQGKYQSDLFINARITGAGISGTSLQKSLAGKLNFNFTNANIQLLSPKAQRLIGPIALILRAPELTETPLNALSASAEIGGGQIDVKRINVSSEAFRAEGQGMIHIAEVLTNSPLNLPVNLALRRSLAQKINLVPSDAPTNSAFVPLPAFVKIVGTLGDPKPEMDKAVIAGLLLKSASGLSGLLPDKTGNLLEGIGNVLTGKPVPAPNTSTNANTRTNLTSRTNKPPQSAPGDLLNELLKKKK